MINVNLEYNIKDDIDYILQAERITNTELSEKANISRTTLYNIVNDSPLSDDVYEKFYSYVYNSNYRINAAKEELIKEKYRDVLFHGSKNGLKEITINGSRDNCDFGKGFYLGETYSQALSFVCEKENSSVYSFRYSLDGLKTKSFNCDLEWMLAICYFRGRLNEWSKNKIIEKIISETETADVIIAPIADNKMLYIMTQFIEGEINADVALHSLSASRLGLQYVFKTDSALERITPIEKYYISVPEREDCRTALNERSYEIDTKLKLAKREYKNGLFIEEIFNERI